MNLAIFGGSFDPPHIGHVQIVRLCLESLDIDRLIILPAFHNRLKTSPLISAKKRLEWAKEVFSKEVFSGKVFNKKFFSEEVFSDVLLSKENFLSQQRFNKNVESLVSHTCIHPLTLEVSDYEILQNRAVPSIESIVHFKNLYKPKATFFIIGVDNLFALPRWVEFERLKSEVEFVVLGREGVKSGAVESSFHMEYNAVDSSLEGFNKIYNMPQKVDSKKYYDFANKNGIKIRFLAFNNNISSTKIRQNIESFRHFIPEKIRESVISEVKNF